MPRQAVLPVLPAALALAALASAVLIEPAPAATLPYHRPLRVLIVSDEVNPHGLSAAQLTQPGEISAALLTPGNGLNLDRSPDAVIEIPTNQIEQVTALLSVSFADPAAYDVLIYFAHRIPNQGSDPVGRQQAFTAAVEAFLEDGGGLVSFHHGSYASPGKEGILDLIGATASGTVRWNTIMGQNVIDTAPGHFITCYGMSYAGTVAYADVARGVALDDYSFFNNTPDERYLVFNYNAAAGTRQTLFGSDYNENGTSHLLGFTHHRPGWTGLVVGYQPGEYQPNALDVSGNNFQALANAMVFAADALMDDDIVLNMERGPGALDVTLSWSSCTASFGVYRSGDPTSVDQPGNLLGTTAASSWTEAPPEAELLYYLVRAGSS